MSPAGPVRVAGQRRSRVVVIPARAADPSGRWWRLEGVLGLDFCDSLRLTRLMLALDSATLVLR